MDTATNVDAVLEQLSRCRTLAGKIDLGPMASEVDVQRWTLDAAVLRLLASVVREMRPGHVIEVGSGISTRWLTRVAAKAELPLAVSSIDHDPVYGEQARRAAEAELQPPVRLACQIAPLVVRSYCGDPLPTYLLEPAKMATSEAADIVLIDGPPDLLGGREGTLYQVMPYLRPGSLILLDDADRPGERECLSRWRDMLDDAIEAHRLPGFPKGLLAIVVRRPVLPAELWSHRQMLAARDLRDRIGEAGPVLLIDGWQLDRAAFEGVALCRDAAGAAIDLSPPADEMQAVQRIAAARRQGAKYLAFAWPALWWLHAYPELRRELDAHGRRLLANRRLELYELE